MATAQTPAQWAEFIAKAETEQTAQQQRLQQILNGSYSDTEKQAAINDYMLQSNYLAWIKSKYAEYSQTGVLPADMTYNCNLSGNVYRYFKEGSTTEYEYKLLELGVPPYADTNEHELAHMQPEEVRTFDLIKSPDLTLQLKVTAGSWADPIINYKYYTGNYPGFSIFTDNYQRTTFEILASGRWATDTSYSPSSSTDSNRNYYKIGYAWGSGFTWIPTWGQQTSAFWGPKSYGPSGTDNTNDIVAQQVTSVQKSGTVDTPWDFYNDEILPSVDPDDAFFPNGYEPIGPGGDPDDGPEEEIAPDKTDWGNPPDPHNTFEVPYTFVNYAAFNEAGLRNFAERLWDAPDSFWDALTITNKNNANWLDYFVSLRAYPYKINYTGTTANIYVGAGGKFYLGDIGTDVYASSPDHLTYYAIALQVPKHYNNFLDFAPYTKAYIYLPFSGVWEVNPKFLYHTRVMIMLTLDITDGSGVWQVYRYADPESATEQAGNYYLILEKQCKIGVEIPLSGLSATTMASNIVNASLASQQRLLSTTTQLLGDAASGNVGKFMTDMAQVPMQALTDSANLANANREIPTASGGMSGLAAANACVIPFITLIRPVVENPESFPHTVGNLVNKASKLEKLSGFTTCRNVDVSNVPQATDKEKAQLKRILEGGFYAVSG